LLFSPSMRLGTSDEAVDKSQSLLANVGERASSRHAAFRIQQICNRGRTKCLLHHLQGFVELRVHWTKLNTMLSESQRARVDALNRIDSVHHIEDSDLIVRSRKADPPTNSTLGQDEARSAQRLENFTEIMGRNVRRNGNLISRLEAAPQSGNDTDSTESIFCSLGKHVSILRSGAARA